MNHETKLFVTPEQQNTLFYSVKTQKSQEAIYLKETPLFSQISIHVANSCSIYSSRTVDRGQDRKILPAPGTNQIAGFGSSCPLTR